MRDVESAADYINLKFPALQNENINTIKQKYNWWITQFAIDKISAMQSGDAQKSQIQVIVLKSDIDTYENEEGVDFDQYANHPHVQQIRDKILLKFRKYHAKIMQKN